MRKKICFIVAVPTTAKAFLLKHFEILSANYDIYLVANFENDNPHFESEHIIAAKNIPIHRDISVFKDASALFELRKYLKSMNFDAVHTVTPKAGLIGILAAKLAGIKIRVHIFTGQVWHTKTGIFKTILKNIDRFIVSIATHILVDGASQREFLIQNNIVGRHNSRVLGKGSISGVDTTQFTPNASIRSGYRNQLALTSAVVFMFLGRMNRDKGILDLAKAFSQLNTKFPESRLILVGPDEGNLQSEVSDICKNCIHAVVFYGPTSKPFEILQAADVFCLPSYREGFGTSVIEASLLEIPIICSDTYGLMETIIENQTGLRHKVGDVAGIESQMEKMMSPELRESFGKQAREYVLRNFSADTISAEWLAFYNELFNETRV